jgi:hypothetical protein
MNIHLVGAELFHADGQTCMTKLIVAFRNVANAPVVYSRKDYKITNTANTSTEEYWLQRCDTVQSSRVLSTLRRRLLSLYLLMFYPKDNVSRFL